MRIYRDKNKLIGCARLLSVLLVIFLCFKLTNLLTDCRFSGDSLEIDLKAVKLASDNELCNNYIVFHIFAFILGAFVNIKRLLKVGVV